MARDTVELRGMVERAVVDVIDAISIARGVDRIALVEAVLQEWAALRLREASVLQRLTRGNPALAELAGKQMEAQG